MVFHEHKVLFLIFPVSESNVAITVHNKSLSALYYTRWNFISTITSRLQVFMQICIFINICNLQNGNLVRKLFHLSNVAESCGHRFPSHFSLSRVLFFSYKYTEIHNFATKHTRAQIYYESVFSNKFIYSVNNHCDAH